MDAIQQGRKGEDVKPCKKVRKLFFIRVAQRFNGEQRTSFNCVLPREEGGRRERHPVEPSSSSTPLASRQGF